MACSMSAMTFRACVVASDPAVKTKS